MPKRKREQPPEKQEKKQQAEKLASSHESGDTRKIPESPKFRDPDDPKKWYWLMKAEPDDVSIEHMENVITMPWSGVRNRLANMYMKKLMREGDRIFFYRSCVNPGVIGIMEVVKSGYVDEEQFDQSKKYYYEKATKENPIWFKVDVKFIRRLEREILLDELKSHSSGNLFGMILFRQSRLSVQNVAEECWNYILELEKQAAPEKQSKGRGSKAIKKSHTASF